MSKQQNIEVFGEVIQELGNSMFKVKLNNMSDSEILCTISGKIRQHYIRIMAGDKVKIEVSPYDLTRGRIVTRLKDTPPPNSTQSVNNSVNKNSSNNKNKKRK